MGRHWKESATISARERENAQMLKLETWLALSLAERHQRKIQFVAGEAYRELLDRHTVRRYMTEGRR